MNEDGATEEREIVSWVEAVPERTEHEDGQRAVTPLVDHVAQPQRRHLVPTVKKHLQAGRKLAISHTILGYLELVLLTVITTATAGCTAVTQSVPCFCPYSTAMAQFAWLKHRCE